MVNLTGGIVTRLPDANIPATLRFHHASINLGPADIYVDDPLTAPIVSAHAFRDVTPDLDMPAGALPITYTTAGNMGSILVDTDFGLNRGLRHHVIFIEDSNGVGELVRYIPDLRSVETFAKVEIANTTQSNALVDVYILQAGETIEEDTLPFLNGLVIGLSPITIPMPEGDFDIYVTPDEDKVPLAGPIPITTTPGDVWQVLIYENVDPLVVDVTVNPLP